MEVNIQTDDIDLGMDRIMNDLLEMDGRFSDVGFHEGVQHAASGKPAALIAHWNNSGTFKPGSGGQHHIPPRRFMKTAMERNGKGQLGKESERLVGSLIDGSVSTKEVSSRIGESHQRQIQKAINRFSTPANAASTIRKKGRNDPLTETGELETLVDHKEGKK